MRAFLVSYDLDKPGQNYEQLIARLKQYSAVRILYSQWVLKTSWTAIQIRDDLQTYMDSNDRLLVNELYGEWATWNIMSTDKFQELAA